MSLRGLLSTIGSRGDVQPLVALALQLRELGKDVRLCAPPDFRNWVDGFGIPFVPIGPEVRSTAKSSSPFTRARPSPEQMRQIAEATVATQFEVIPAAAEGCDILVAGGALQIALRSVAEQRGIPYVYASYCPASLPSPHHAPPAWVGDKPTDGAADNRQPWAEDAQRWNASWGVALNAHRASAGLNPVDDVRSHIFTDQPWLAADPTLAPWPEPSDLDVIQTGAWILPDERPLSPELEAFLAAGQSPIYFGFGSIRAPEDLSQKMIQAARALGRRAIVSRGWAELSPPDDGPDCLSIGEVNQQALFQRVAAVVHHGARAPQPQRREPAHPRSSSPSTTTSTTGHDESTNSESAAHTRPSYRPRTRWLRLLATPCSPTSQAVPNSLPAPCAPTAQRPPRSDWLRTRNDHSEPSKLRDRLLAAGAGHGESIRLVVVRLERGQTDRCESAERRRQGRAEIPRSVRDGPPERRSLSSCRKQLDAVARTEAAAADRLGAENDDRRLPWQRARNRQQRARGTGVHRDHGAEWAHFESGRWLEDRALQSRRSMSRRASEGGEGGGSAQSQQDGGRNDRQSERTDAERRARPHEPI